MKQAWNRFLVWIGIRKVNPHNLTAADVSLENVERSEIAGRPAVFRTTPPERGPKETPRRFVPPRGQSASSSRSTPVSRYDTPSRSLASSSSNSGRSDDLLDGLTTLVLVNELAHIVSEGHDRAEPDPAPEPVVPTPPSSSSWDGRTAVDPEPGSWNGGTRFDSAETTNFGGGSDSSDGFFKSVGDAISSVGESISDATSSWSD